MTGNNKEAYYKEYSEIPQERFTTIDSEITLRFFQIPKSLYNNHTYKGLSMGAKQMYSVLRDRQDLSIKNNWSDDKGNIFLIYTVKNLAEILDTSARTVIRYKKLLVKYGLIFEKRRGQGNPNLIYILEPELNNSQKCQFVTSRSDNKSPLGMTKCHPIDTDVNHPNLNNVKEGKKPPPVENSTNNNNEIKNQIEGQIELDIGKKLPNKNKKSRSPEKESLAKEILNQMGDEHSLGFYRKVVDLVPETAIWRALSIVKDTFLQGNIKKSKGALFTTTIKEISLEQNIKL